MPTRPSNSPSTRHPTQPSGSRRFGARVTHLLAPAILLLLLGTGSVFGASRGCVSAPLHGASQTVVGEGPGVTTQVTFSGQTAYSTSQVWVVMGKIVAPGTLGSQVIVGGGPIYPDGDRNFSETLDVRRDGGGSGGTLWNDDDAAGFMLYEFDKVNGYTFTPLDTYQAQPGYAVTKHGIAAVSDRPDADKLPHEISLGFFVAPPQGIQTEFQCRDETPLSAGVFKCPIPGDRFPQQLNGHFLAKKQPLLDVAAAERYYDSFPASAQHRTLDDFKSANGFNVDVHACKSDDRSVNVSGETCAWYRNEMDLGFGRQMHCLAPPNLGWGILSKVACYVTNFKNENDAFNNTPLLQVRNPDTEAATVAMTWQSGGADSDRVRFYVYSQSGDRLTTAKLDGGDAKAVPGLCLNCHGGQYDSNANTVVGSHLLPFDQVTLPMAGARPDQNDKIKDLNLLVALTEFLGNDSQPTPISDLTLGWYDGFAEGSSYNAGFVPDAWSQNPALYLGVVAPYCRSCHTAQSGPLAWTSLADFNLLEQRVRQTVCMDRSMPHAERTYQRFWEGGAPAILATEMGPLQHGSGGDPYDACSYKPLPPVPPVL